MILYSHLFVASNLEKRLNPQSREDYYLGAVIPDIRYYCGLSRHNTHLPIEEIVEFGNLYPHLHSFVLGYLVHCGVDELVLTDIVLRRFPFSLIRNRLPPQFTPVLFEYYLLEKIPLQKRVSESSNEMLDDLGIDPTAVLFLSRQLNKFFSAPSCRSELNVAQNLGLLNHSGVKGYLRAANTIHRNSVLKKLLFASIDLEDVNRQIGSHLFSLPAVVFLIK